MKTDISEIFGELDEDAGIKSNVGRDAIFLHLSTNVAKSSPTRVYIR